MLPDFNRLKVFYFVFRLGSVIKAAQELHVTQSAVSQSLLKLEEELQQALFTRLHKKLVPTPQAQSLMRLLEPFISDLEREIEGIQHAKVVPCGFLRIGAPEEFGEQYLVPISAAFQKQYSEVTIQIETGHPSQLLPKVERGELDFSFADMFSGERGRAGLFKFLDIREVFQEHLILACSQDYFSQKLDSQVTFDILSSADYVSYQPEAPAIKNWFRHHYGKSSMKIKNALIIESVRGVIGGIREGLGLGLVPSHLVSEELKKGEFVHIKVKSHEIINSISLVRLLDKIEILAEKTFIRFFSDKINLQLKSFQ